MMLLKAKHVVRAAIAKHGVGTTRAMASIIAVVQRAVEAGTVVSGAAVMAKPGDRTDITISCCCHGQAWWWKSYLSPNGCWSVGLPGPPLDLVQGLNHPRPTSE